MSSLVPFWYIVIAVLWTGFFILEGFDFGVGMLHSVVGRDEAGRRAAINTVGPLWDGNEVWLITAGAAMFAAFPGWYATMFSAYYLALVLLLAALIVRGVAFEYRGKRDAARWRRTWDVLMTAGSVLAPLLIGVALGGLLHGLPIKAEVTGIDAEGRRALATRPFGEQLEFGYDYLIVAAGVQQSYFGHGEFAEWAPGMKSIEDALTIRRRVFGAFDRDRD